MRFMAEPPPAGAHVALGRYRHFKGGEYEVLRVARHTETDEVVVIYCPVHDPHTVWARPLEAFTSQVKRPEGTTPRFERLPEHPRRQRGLVWLLIAALQGAARRHVTSRVAAPRRDTHRDVEHEGRSLAAH